ncbi:MAG: hemin receptor [Bacteroidetes bacterium]|nr:hemin receptor [Bacteroidota bacterium]
MTILSDHQIALVRSSYDRILPVAEETGDLFFSRLFEIAPYVRPLFHGDIHLQGRKVMEMLTFIVISADDLEQLTPRLHRLGKEHREHGVISGHYDIFASALLWTLERMLGREFTDDVRNAWVALYVEVTAPMKKGAAGEPKAA